MISQFCLQLIIYVRPFLPVTAAVTASSLFVLKSRHSPGCQVSQEFHNCLGENQTGSGFLVKKEFRNNGRNVFHDTFYPLTSAVKIA